MVQERQHSGEDVTGAGQWCNTCCRAGNRVWQWFAGFTRKELSVSFLVLKGDPQQEEVIVMEDAVVAQASH